MPATKTTPAAAIFLKHESGAMHELSARKVAHLRKEILAGRGGPEVTQLTMNGYQGFLGDSGEVEDFEAGLTNHFKRQVIG